MQFTARQLEVARWALRNGQSEVSFARDNAMSVGDARWLLEMAAADLRREERDHTVKVKRDLEGALERLQRESEHVGMLRYDSCRVHCNGHPVIRDTV